MQFTEASQNLVLVGDTGTGKTHMTIAIGVLGTRHHNKKVRSFIIVDLTYQSALTTVQSSAPANKAD